MNVVFRETIWREHETYVNDEAMAKAQMFFYHKQVGYSGVKLQVEHQEHATIFRISVLVTR